MSTSKLPIAARAQIEAERVMQAGYEGVSFEELRTCGMLGRDPRLVRNA